MKRVLVVLQTKEYQSLCLRMQHNTRLGDGSPQHTNLFHSEAGIYTSGGSLYESAM
jgi:hypothetical protein